MSILPIQPLQSSSSDPYALSGQNTSTTTGVARTALHAAATVVGITPAALHTALQQGASIPTLAHDRGVPAQAAQDAMRGSLGEKLRAGVITQSQYNKLQQLATELATGKLTYSQYIAQSSVVA